MKIIYFGGTWCGQCHVLKPQVQAFCKEKNIELVEYDAEKDGDKVAEYNIRNLPTVILEDGECIIRATGIAQWNKLKEDLQNE